MNNTRLGALTIAVAAVCAATGCQDAGMDRTGGTTITLRLASIDGPDVYAPSPAPQAFVEALKTLSQGRINVELHQSYGNGATTAESELVGRIASGEIDGGWPAARAFATAGVTGLEVLESPMTITTEEAADAVATDPVASDLLKRLDKAGLRGLAIAPAGLRRPFATEAPLVDPADWKGVTFRTFNSVTETAALKALGAVPVNVGIPWNDEVSARRLRGVDLDLGSSGAGSPTAVPNATANVVLWPKYFVFVLNGDRFAGLSAVQQGWVTAAARQAAQAAVAAESDEASSVRDLCDRGVRVVTATPAQIAGLKAALRPVTDQLAADPAVARIRQIGSSFPAQTIHIPTGCTGTGSTAGAAVPASSARIPDGAYRATVTYEDVARAGGDRDRSHPQGVWTLAVSKGTFTLQCRPVEPSRIYCGGVDVLVPVEAGYLRGDNKVLYIVSDAQMLARLTGCRLPSSSQEGHCNVLAPYGMNWTLKEGKLTFTPFAGPPRLQQWTLKPYDKIS